MKEMGEDTFVLTVITMELVFVLALAIIACLTGCTLTPDQRITRAVARMTPADWEAVWADEGMAPPEQAPQTEADRVMAELDAQMEGR